MCWHGYLSGTSCVLHMICMWSSWCHCCPVISCFIIVQKGLTFLVLAYPGSSGISVVSWVLLQYVICITWAVTLWCHVVSGQGIIMLLMSVQLGTRWLLYNCVCEWLVICLQSINLLCMCMHKTRWLIGLFICLFFLCIYYRNCTLKHTQKIWKKKLSEVVLDAFTK